MNHFHATKRHKNNVEDFLSCFERPSLLKKYIYIYIAFSDFNNEKFSNMTIVKVGVFSKI